MEIIEAAKIGAACLVAIAATGASLETANNYYGFKNRYHRAAAVMTGCGALACTS